MNLIIDNLLQELSNLALRRISASAQIDSDLLKAIIEIEMSSFDKIGEMFHFRTPFVGDEVPRWLKFVRWFGFMMGLTPLEHANYKIRILLIQMTDLERQRTEIISKWNCKYPEALEQIDGLIDLRIDELLLLLGR